MRYIIYGAGAVGATIGALLHDSGREVVLIARGAHLDALIDRGLTLRRPGGETHHRVPAVGSPKEAGVTSDDVVMLTMKTQDTVSALDALTVVAPPDVAIVCAQNGVENERLALRRLERVYGICVMLPALHLEPGVVCAYGDPRPGILDVGRYPTGIDHVAEQVAADLDAAGFSSRADATVMRFKYRKLVTNTGTAIEAVAGLGFRGTELGVRARDEAHAVLDAAGIDVASVEEDERRRKNTMTPGQIDGVARGGGSSWQSLARQSGSIEVDYLNGEIVMLGRMHGVPTPANALLQAKAKQLASDKALPGSVSLEELAEGLEAGEGT